MKKMKPFLKILPLGFLTFLLSLVWTVPVMWGSDFKQIGTDEENKRVEQSSTMAGESEYFSNIEKQVMEEINKARVNPKQFAESYLRDTNYSALYREVQGIPPMAPLLPSQELHLAAKDYLEKELGTESSMDFSKKPSGFRERIERYGIWEGQIAESISCGSKKPVDIVINLLLTKGSQKNNVMNPAYRYVGIAFGLHKAYRYICVLDFATGIEQRSK